MFRLFLLELLLLAVSASDQKLRCPGKVTKFSSNESKQHFYECGSDGFAVLKKCPSDDIYHTGKQICIPRQNEEKNKAIVQKTLGRKFRLGALFDAKNNKPYPDYSLWNKTTIDAEKFSYDRLEVETTFTADSLKRDRASHFSVDGELTVNVMAGQITAEGGMEYISDEVSSENEVNVQMLFHSTARAETIPRFTKIDTTQYCGDERYTHVITSLTYGFDANFCFKRLLKSEESKSTIFGEMKLAINMIPSFSISGGGSVNLTESGKELFESVSLNMYGDYQLAGTGLTPPSDFDTACSFYANITKLAPEQLKVHEAFMTPIEDVCGEEMDIINDIKDSLIEEVLGMLDKLDQLKIKTSGLQITAPAQKFTALGHNLQLYADALINMTSQTNQRISEILPSIKGGGGHSEEDLVQLLTDYTQSQFELDTSTTFLIDRNREITSVSFLLESFPDIDGSNIALLDYGQANDNNYFLKYDYVLNLKLNILSDERLTNDFLSGNPQNESNFWYNDIEVNGEVGAILRTFSDFALENINHDDQDFPFGFLLELDILEESDGDVVAVYEAYSKKDGYYERPFDVPKAPEKPDLFDIDFDHTKFIVPKYNQYTNGLRVHVNNLMTNETVPQDDINWALNAEGSETVEAVVSDLDYATVYSLSAQYLTKHGQGPRSETTDIFITAPTSIPRNPTVSALSDSLIKVTWEAPSFIGERIENLQYNVVLEGQDGFTRSVITSEDKLEATFENIASATNYLIKLNSFVTVDFSTFANETLVGLQVLSVSQTATLRSTTSPPAPTIVPPWPGELLTQSVKVRWLPPSILPDDVTAQNLTYELVKNDSLVATSISDNFFLVENLSPNTNYGFRVKASSDSGLESEWSEEFIIKTLDEGDEMSHFTDTIKGRLTDLLADLRVKSSFCATASEIRDDGVITYDSLTVDESSVPSAQLDINTGIFQAGKEGSYRVMVSAEVMTGGGDSHTVKLLVNGEEMKEATMEVSFPTSLYGLGTDNAGRQMVLSLSPGDTIAVHHQQTNHNTGLLRNVLFCVTSLPFNIE